MDVDLQDPLVLLLQVGMGSAMIEEEIKQGGNVRRKDMQHFLHVHAELVSYVFGTLCDLHGLTEDDRLQLIDLARERCETEWEVEEETTH